MDPGIGKPDLVKNVKDKLESHNLKPIAVLITHGHLDHFFGISANKRNSNADIHYKN